MKMITDLLTKLGLMKAQEEQEAPAQAEPNMPAESAPEAMTEEAPTTNEPLTTEETNQ